jgi:hypothetical protein
MTKKPRHSESPGKTGASADRSAKGGPTEPMQSPMARFQALTKRLLNVSHKQVQEEHRRFNAANAARRRNKDGNA